jgi:hypothetical protein
MGHTLAVGTVFLLMRPHDIMMSFRRIPQENGKTITKILLEMDRGDGGQDNLEVRGHDISTR